MQPSVLAAASGGEVRHWLGCVQDLGRNDAVTTHWSDLSLLRAGIFQEVLADSFRVRLWSCNPHFVGTTVTPVCFEEEQHGWSLQEVQLRHGYSLLPLVSCCKGYSASLNQR